MKKLERDETEVDQLAVHEGPADAPPLAMRRTILIGALIAMAFAGIAYLTWWGFAAAAVLLALALILEFRTKRRTKMISDGRAVGFGMGVFLLLTLPLGLLSQPLRDGSWWLPLAYGSLWGVLYVVNQYLVDRYQGRRLKTGDYGKYDLI